MDGPKIPLRKLGLLLGCARLGLLMPLDTDFPLECYLSKVLNQIQGPANIFVTVIYLDIS